MDNQSSKVHYVCPGECGGVSREPGDCQAQACSFYGQPLHKCECEDGQHRQGIPTSAAAAPA